MPDTAPRMSMTVGIPLGAAAIVGGLGAAKVAFGVMGGHPAETIWWVLMCAGLGLALVLALVARK